MAEVAILELPSYWAYSMNGDIRNEQNWRTSADQVTHARSSGKRGSLQILFEVKEGKSVVDALNNVMRRVVRKLRASSA